MPYIVCPACGLRTYTAATNWLRRCERCGASLAEEHFSDTADDEGEGEHPSERPPDTIA